MVLRSGGTSPGGASPSPQLSAGHSVAFYTEVDSDGQPDVAFGSVASILADGANFKLKVANGDFLRTLESSDLNTVLSITSSPGRTSVHERTYDAVTRAVDTHQLHTCQLI